MTSRVAVYGGINVDVKWRALAHFEEGASSFGEKSEYFGGVARNIAECLARLSIPCSLISRVGNDEAGRCSIAHLKNLLIDVDSISISDQFHTAQYCAFFHSSGELNTALIDMRVTDEITADMILSTVIAQKDAIVHVIDTDLSANVLHAIAEQVNTKIWACVTSVTTANRLSNLLNRTDALFVNRHELAALVKENYSFSDAINYCLDQGAKNLIITLGADGVYFASSDQRFHVPASLASVVDVTGAGDAVVATTLAAYLNQLPFHDGLIFGMEAARLTLETKESVSPQLSKIASLIHERTFQISRRNC